jgi:hypothetical protein
MKWSADPLRGRIGPDPSASLAGTMVKMSKNPRYDSCRSAFREEALGRNDEIIPQSRRRATSLQGHALFRCCFR